MFFFWVLTSRLPTVATRLVSARFLPWLKPLSIVTLELVKRNLHKSNLIKLFTQFRLIFHTHGLTLTMECWNLWKPCYRFTHAFFTQYKSAFLLSVVNVSLHYLPSRLRLTVTCGKMPSTIIGSEALKICCHVIVTQ